MGFTEQYRHIGVEKRLKWSEDCYISRTHADHPGKAVVVDRGDMTVFLVFDSSWLDDDIWIAVQIANEAYSMGVGAGVSAFGEDVTRLLSSALSLKQKKTPIIAELPESDWYY